MPRFMCAKRRQTFLIEPDARPALKVWVLPIARAQVAQSAEHILGKDEVTSSILVLGSISFRTPLDSHRHRS